MPLFVLTYDYTSQEARTAARADHLGYLGRLHAAGDVVLAGPFADGVGALVLLRADSLADAEALVTADPYTARGVSTNVQVREWKQAVPADQ